MMYVSFICEVLIAFVVVACLISWSNGRSAANLEWSRIIGSIKVSVQQCHVETSKVVFVTAIST